MFALIQYNNAKYSVIRKNKMTLLDNGECIVKNKGYIYKAFFIVYNSCHKDLETIAKNLNNNKPNIILYQCQNIKNNTSSSVETNDNLIIDYKDLKSFTPYEESYKIELYDNTTQVKEDINSCLYVANDDLNNKEENNVSNTFPVSIVHNNTIQDNLIIFGNDDKFHLQPNAGSTTSDTVNISDNNSSLYITDYDNYINIIEKPTWTALTSNNNVPNYLHPTIDSIITTNVNCSANDSDFKLQPNELNEPSVSAVKNVTMTKQNESRQSNDFLQESFNIVNACNDEEMYVNTSKDVNKKHFCFYCKKLQSKIARHLEMVHSTEEEVKRFIYLPKGNYERKKIINTIRKKGDYLFNTNRNYNTTELIVCRRPSKAKQGKASEFICCASCKGYFTKNNIRHHAAICFNHQGERCVHMLGRTVSGRIHSNASNILRNKIFPILRDDTITRLIRYDSLIILYGNKMSIKYRHQYQEDMIRARLRLLGRFLLAIKKIQPAINDFSSLYDPRFYDDCISAVRVVARYNAKSNTFGAPFVATGLGTLLKQIGIILISDCIKNHMPEKKEKAEDFIILLSEDYTTNINEAVEETITKNRQQKEVILPSLKDIQVLHEYLLQERISNYEKVQKSFSYNDWLNLAKSTLLSILLFNRRKPVELEHIFIEDYEKYESLDENNYPDLFNTLTEEMKILAKKYVRFVITGKLGKSVPVLLSANFVQCIQMILKHRKNAQVPDKNPYIFGLPSSISNRYKYLKACNLMREYSLACKARVPHSLRSTQLRKYIAQCRILNIFESQTLLLANHMGHDAAIHKKHYRQSYLNKEIIQLSKFLEKASGNDANEEDEAKDCVPTTIFINDIISINEQNEIESISSHSEHEFKYEVEVQDTSISKKRRSTSPCGARIKRVRWNEQERNTVLKAFNEEIRKSQLPSLKAIQILKTENMCLNKRTPPQIKTYLHNIISRKRKL